MEDDWAFFDPARLDAQLSQILQAPAMDAAGAGAARDEQLLPPSANDSDESPVFSTPEAPVNLDKLLSCLGAGTLFKDWALGDPSDGAPSTPTLGQWHTALAIDRLDETGGSTITPMDANYGDDLRGVIDGSTSDGPVLFPANPEPPGLPCLSEAQLRDLALASDTQREQTLLRELRVAELTQQQAAGATAAARIPCCEPSQELLAVLATGQAATTALPPPMPASTGPSARTQPTHQLGPYAFHVSEAFREHDYAPLIQLDLTHRVVGSDAQLKPSLSRPAFAPESRGTPSEGLFICGTEEDAPERSSENRLIVSRIQIERDPESQGIEWTFSVLWSCGIDAEIRDVQWHDPSNAVFAAGAHIGVLRVEADTTIGETVMLPKFHHDVIREMAVSPVAVGRVATGGFDGSVFVVDVEHVVQDMEANKTSTALIRYPCHDVVGSVAWHPTSPHLCSCTTDVGAFHQFDVRCDAPARRESLVFRSRHRALYTHTYAGENQVLLGFGDGTVSLFDTRTDQLVGSLTDPAVQAVGDIVLTRDMMVVSGAPTISLWSRREARFDFVGKHAMAGYHPVARATGISPSGAKASCAAWWPSLSPHKSLLAVTDSDGLFTVYAPNGIPLSSP